MKSEFTLKSQELWFIKIQWKSVLRSWKDSQYYKSKVDTTSLIDSQDKST